jgi:hypothetical protein
MPLYPNYPIIMRNYFNDFRNKYIGGVMANKNAVHQRYYTKDGELVAGSTTILSVMAKPNLIRWAWNCGIKGEDYTKVRDSAGSVGTITHLMITEELQKAVKNVPHNNTARR